MVGGAVVGAAKREVGYIGACVIFAALEWKLRDNRTIIFHVIWRFDLCTLTSQVSVGDSAGIENRCFVDIVLT